MIRTGSGRNHSANQVRTFFGGLCIKFLWMIPGKEGAARSYKECRNLPIVLTPSIPDQFHSRIDLNFIFIRFSKPENSIWREYSVTRIEKLNSRLAAAKHADGRKLMQKSIIRADEPPKHAGNSAFAAIEITKPCGFWGRPVQMNLIMCAGRGK
jgi:hypothetical protein